jgi:hypothetical protein
MKTVFSVVLCCSMFWTGVTAIVVAMADLDPVIIPIIFVIAMGVGLPTMGVIVAAGKAEKKI